MADPGKTFTLSSASKSWNGIGVPDGMPKEKLGKPCRYAKIDAVWPGEWLNHNRGFILSVDSPRIQHWNSTINGMCAAGVPIPIPLDHIPGAENNQGFVVGSQVVGDTLYPICQFVGDKAWEIAAKNFCSIGVIDEKIDANGTKWPDAIFHLALTESPAIIGQKGFTQLASLIPNSGEILMSTSGEQNMDTMLPCSDECMAGMCDLIPGWSAMSDADKMPHLHGHLKAMKSGMARMSAEKDALAGQVQTMSTAAAAGGIRLLSADLVPDVRDSASTYADLAVEKGALSPGVRDALHSYLVGTAEKPNQFCMSLNPQTNNRPAVEVFKILLSNQPKPAQGAQTGTNRLMSGRESGSRNPYEDTATTSTEPKMVL